MKKEEKIKEQELEKKGNFSKFTSFFLFVSWAVCSQLLFIIEQIFVNANLFFWGGSLPIGIGSNARDGFLCSFFRLEGVEPL